jgi:hypothetical protein
MSNYYLILRKKMSSFWNGNKRINELGAGHFHTTKISDNFEDDTFHELLISKYYLFMV